MFALLPPAECILAIWTPGIGQIFLLLIIALLLYGGELPQKAREWGKIVADLRKQLGSMQKEFNDVVYSDPPKPQKLQHYPEFRDVEPLTPGEDVKSPGKPDAAGLTDPSPPPQQTDPTD